jgi:hypothetical protein
VILPSKPIGTCQVGRGRVAAGERGNEHEILVKKNYSGFMADLHGVHAKLERARVHARSFDATAQDIFNRRPFELVGSVEGDSFVIRWKQNGHYPDFWPLSSIFGDMLYNLRATLDYLVWQLVLLNNTQPTANNSFPCVRREVNWNSAVGRQLSGVSTNWIEEIKKLQPFDATHSGPPEHHSLALLDEANNVNKHRLLPATLLTPGHVSFNIGGLTAGTKVTQDFSDDPIVSDGAMYVRLTFDRPSQLAITLDQNPSFRIKIADITDYDWRNWDLINWVEQAVGIFESAFAA